MGFAAEVVRGVGVGDLAVVGAVPVAGAEFAYCPAIAVPVLAVQVMDLTRGLSDVWGSVTAPPWSSSRRSRRSACSLPVFVTT